jgi:hypothetical protein
LGIARDEVAGAEEGADVPHDVERTDFVRHALDSMDRLKTGDYVLLLDERLGQNSGIVT